MSATSFGGSFDSVRTNDNGLICFFTYHLKKTAIHSTFPFLKWLPFMQPHTVAEIDRVTDAIVSRRLLATDQTQKDLLQIFLDTHKTNPDSFSEKHLKEE